MFNTEDVERGQTKVVDVHSTHHLLSKSAGNLCHLEDAGRVLDKLLEGLEELLHSRRDLCVITIMEG